MSCKLIFPITRKTILLNEKVVSTLTTEQCIISYHSACVCAQTARGPTHSGLQ